MTTKYLFVTADRIKSSNIYEEINSKTEMMGKNLNTKQLCKFK